VPEIIPEIDEAIPQRETLRDRTVQTLEAVTLPMNGANHPKATDGSQFSENARG